VLRRISGSERKKQQAGEKCILRSFIICTLHKIVTFMVIKEDEVDGACSMHETDEKRIQKFWSENLKEETTWKT